ncbi:MAG: hypothetical protein ACLRS8_05875 [Parabacteroides merdae]
MCGTGWRSHLARVSDGRALEAAKRAASWAERTEDEHPEARRAWALWMVMFR